MSTNERERRALIALLSHPEAKPHLIAAGINETGSALKVLEQNLPNNKITVSSHRDPIELALREAAERITQWSYQGIGVHTMLDSSYPQQLLSIKQMPPVVFTKGTLATDACTVAIVGSRRPSKAGHQIARAIAEELAKRGITVVSGLAAGIATIAHTAALASHARTVAVIGTGLNYAYPRENQPLQNKIAEKGLVLSQFFPEFPPTRWAFLARNAVMSGYSAATIVVEAGEYSGAPAQATMALEHRRPVIFPGELVKKNAWAREYTNHAGVHVVQDLRETLNLVEELLGLTYYSTKI